MKVLSSHLDKLDRLVDLSLSVETEPGVHLGRHATLHHTQDLFTEQHEQPDYVVFTYNLYILILAANLRIRILGLPFP